MGFRNPVTSVNAAAVASSVSTATLGPKVQIYEKTDNSTGQIYGVVEFDDGVGGDAPALLARTVTSNPANSSTPLGGLSLDSGSYGLDNTGQTQGPKLALNVELPASGTGPNVAVARLASPGGFTINGVPQLGGPWTVDYTNGSYNAALLSGGWGSLPGCTVSLTVPVGQVAEIEFRAPWLSLVAGAEVALRLQINGVTVDGADYQAASAMRCPIRLGETLTGTGTAITVAVQAILAAGASSSCSIQASAGAPVVLRHRIR